MSTSSSTTDKEYTTRCVEATSSDVTKPSNAIARRKKVFNFLSSEYYENLRSGKYNTCFMCGEKGHYARDCEKDEFWHQSVIDGCYTFWYCEFCGDEFMEENEYESHNKKCNT